MACGIRFGYMDVAEAHAVACSGELDYYSTVYQCPNCSAAFAEPEVADLHIVNCAGDETSGEERTASLETSDIDYAILDIMESKYEDFKKMTPKREKNAIGLLVRVLGRVDSEVNLRRGRGQAS